MKVKYLRIEEIIQFHDWLIEKYGGAAGIRDLGLLSSATAMAAQSFEGSEMHRTLYEKAAAYLYHIIKNHPFIDGNKRTGVFATLVFLKRNGAFENFNEVYLEEIAVGVANNSIDKTELILLLTNPKGKIL